MTRTPRTEGAPAPQASDSPRTYGAALARLRASAGKSNKGAAGYTRWVNRPLGRRIAALAYVRGLTPNQLTWFSGVLTLTGITLIAVLRPSWPVNVGIALLLLFAYTFDSADGQLARLRGGGSLAGEYLDHGFDAAKTCTVHLAVLIAWFRHYDVSHGTLLIPLAFAAVHPLFFFSLMLSDSMKARRAGTDAPVPAGAEPAPWLQSVVVLPNDWGVVCLCLGLLGWHSAFIVVYALLLAANTVFLLVGLVRWYRRLLPAN
jgi:phosphatidylglycerophosphate synthase